MADIELDVREIPKPLRHPKIFGIFDDLSVGEALILVNDHDPIPLHGQFEDVRAGAYSWEYLVREPRDYRIRIGKTADVEPASTDAPAATHNPAAAPESAQQLLGDN
ncbi:MULTISPECIES: DUF2249 domain-containing protein [Gordonia]|uniref:DUF2249 domain-containing protein n=1 Tax=Gordonia amicalis TaxID=89053 RepID=A0AAE4U8S3_9ACTN|nr:MULTISPECIES: DUF2249 domain-containing protein [Gordonia]MCZ0911995.1 DUF2249 domain-containing protein [Gordonia amicalis]MDJ0453980.1 DUF2249 domain-containing protein [Gordonia amicalis]MDV6311643.1 DUF2249 domain-containing protein [Gordonia amicalis]MDV7077126.1 DUF2249 domain-containing protein [Gordonia amicalis]UKO93485.1 DUF2249 domain-containing protein [Gordonia amicalis]